MKQFLIDEILKRTWFFKNKKRKQLENMDIVALMGVYYRKCCK